MSSINTDFFSEDNIGSGYAIYLLPVSAVAIWPEKVNGKYINDVELVGGYAWNLLKFTKNTLGIKIDYFNSKGMRRAEHKIRGVLPKHRLDITQELLGFDRRDKFICLFEFMNGNKILLGTPDHPIKIEYDADSGAAPPDLNHYGININWTDDVQAPAYDTDVWVKNCDPVTIYVDGEFYGSFAPGSRVDIEVDSIFLFHYHYKDPSGIHTLIEDFEPHTFTRAASLNGIGVQSAGIEYIWYSKDQLNWIQLNPPVNFAIGETLYWRIQKQQGSNSGNFSAYGNY